MNLCAGCEKGFEFMGEVLYTIHVETFEKGLTTNGQTEYKTKDG